MPLYLQVAEKDCSADIVYDPEKKRVYFAENTIVRDRPLSEEDASKYQVHGPFNKLVAFGSIQPQLDLYERLSQQELSEEMDRRHLSMTEKNEALNAFHAFWENTLPVLKPAINKAKNHRKRMLL